MKTYIIGNWKMNFTVGESSLFLHKLLQRVRSYRDIEVVVSPSLMALQSLSLQTDRRKIKLATQNFYHRDFGAFTGEVSIAQLRSLVDYAIVGHSERRYIFNESDKDIRAKVAAALRNGLTPILCIGETDSERTFGETADVLRDQLLGGLSEVSAEEVSKCIIAYEPVWAISGHDKAAKVASPLDVKDAFALIRKILKETYGKETAEDTPLLFGGSVKSINAESYLLLEDCNGLLIGGASLIASEFTDIIEIAKRVKDANAQH
ncbi:triose-phosphate isomerase [Candidatus Saccharibacteria bacterium]|nr:triose-phosphate isomerase [Candidatus Saccharibacteria bacterium]